MMNNEIQNQKEENGDGDKNKVDWFEAWFNSPLYEQLYANRDEQEAERLAELILHKLPPDYYNPVLDLGCGRGRHSITLAKRGYQVTGVDLSPRAVETARERAEEEGLDELTQFKVGDMRQPVGSNFQLIVNLFTTFGYFEDDEENIAVLQNVKNMLKPDGYFVFDYLNAVQVRNSITPEEKGTLDSDAGASASADANTEKGTHQYHITRNIDVDSRTVRKHITFETSSGEERTFTERVKLYDKSWFEKQLKQLGFTIENIFGDYDGEAFDETTSPRLLIFARNSKS